MSPRILIPAVAAIAVVGLVLALITPFPRSLPAGTGDAALVEDVRTALDGGPGHHALAVVRIDAEGTRGFAGFGADEHTEFEIGSVSKTFTAMLFADAVERGEVTPETTLGEVFGERVGNARDVTLDALASHRSGLPRLAPAGGTEFARTFALTFLRLDPYVETRDDLLDGLTDLEIPADPEPLYSNYGTALLGMALEESTGTGYADLLSERIIEPLGMTDTYAPITPEGLRPDAPRGHTASGLPAGAWTLGPQAPAGGIRSTPHDMAIWLAAVEDGTAPGAAAAEPRHPFEEPEEEIGWAWITAPLDSGEGELTAHSGMTGGYASFVGFTDSGDAVVALANTAADVGGTAALLGGTAVQGGTAADPVTDDSADEGAER
ncbi:serine hydrolase domain-containing protein [Brevibacterium ihuae]|uniref:serine hydrolase domain-containing protein n=1 Tax=Brevibacterium ihuae TaxID=1631743 RepID=UPI000C77479D|nr:serine hydrolase domain-containing protein [Brevibacterium ihuae]